MKHIVRAFVLSLVAVGAFASTHTDANASAKAQLVSMQNSATPTPACPPTGNTTCGWDK